MLTPARLILCLTLLVSAACGPSPEGIPDGNWSARVTLPGGELPFELELDLSNREQPRATVISGDERIEVGEVSLDGDRLSLVFPAFNNRIDATVSGRRMEGTLTLVKRYGKEQVMPFVAESGTAGSLPSPAPATAPAANVDGRWAVTFVDDDGKETMAVAEFARAGSELTGTFLTPTGDYRYLAGHVTGNDLRLATFDGAHAFLFAATIKPDGTLAGDFWSGTQWHESWAARRDEAAALPDANAMTWLKEGYDEVAFTFPDEQGNEVSLSDPRFDGKVVLITLAGSWCPNCHDEAAFMAPFFQAYRDQGLEIVALMFEHFGDFDTAATQVGRFRDKFGIEYTTLIAGISDKDQAGAALPMLNKVLAYPTTIFIDRSGSVRRIHTGFSGPGTGEHYEELTGDFTRYVESLLAEQAAG